MVQDPIGQLDQFLGQALVVQAGGLAPDRVRVAGLRIVVVEGHARRVETRGEDERACHGGSPELRAAMGADVPSSLGEQRLQGLLGGLLRMERGEVPFAFAEERARRSPVLLGGSKPSLGLRSHGPETTTRSTGPPGGRTIGLDARRAESLGETSEGAAEGDPPPVDNVHVDELIYRLYLRLKLAAAEADIASRRGHSIEEVRKAAASWRP